VIFTAELNSNQAPYWH